MATEGGTGRSIIISALSAEFEESVGEGGALNPYFELELSGTRVQTKVAFGADYNQNLIKPALSIICRYHRCIWHIVPIPRFRRIQDSERIACV